LARKLLLLAPARRPLPFDILSHQWFKEQIKEHDNVVKAFVINRDTVDAVKAVIQKTKVHYSLLDFIYSNIAAEVEQ